MFCNFCFDIHTRFMSLFLFSLIIRAYSQLLPQVVTFFVPLC